MVMAARGSYRAVMWLRNASGEAIVTILSAPSLTPRTVTSP
jgi:hypothetical protein